MGMIHNFKFENSSMLYSCSYDDENKELTVTFRNSKSYTYIDVDKSIYDGLIDAASAGKYFNAIKQSLVLKK